jgi:hypothetical protein
MSGSTLSFSYAAGGELLRSDFMEAHMRERAGRMKDFAEAIAPVYSGRGGDRHRGRYKAGFEVSSTREGGVRNDRAAGYLTNTSPEAVYVEFGTSRQRGHHTLREAMISGALD